MNKNKESAAAGGNETQKSSQGTGADTGILVKEQLDGYRSALHYLRSENTRLKASLFESTVSKLKPIKMPNKQVEWGYDDEMVVTADKKKDKRDKTGRDRERVVQQLHIINQEMSALVEEVQHVRSVVRVTTTPGAAGDEHVKQKQQLASLGLAAREIDLRLRQALVPKKSKSAYRFKFFPPTAHRTSTDNYVLWGRVTLPGLSGCTRTVTTTPVEMSYIHRCFTVT